MINKSKKFRGKSGVFDIGYDIIEYPKGVDVLLAYEFNVFNLGDDDVEIQFNNEGDNLVLEPGEGFEVSLPIEHAVVKTDKAVLKYTYWI